MASVEIAEELQLPERRVAGALHRLHRGERKGTIHIARWEYDLGDGRRRYPRPIFALGSKRDAPKPKPPTDTEHCRAYRARKKSATPSVFLLGVPPKQRNVLQRAEVRPTLCGILP
ncbi:hypothetical protein [Caldimonas sp. KR1-144]|uniref:hypothetical protein n=1 Tax=Caldimonas sp. KR1-144 TaxID=3400911 RepID=UPI003C122B0B